jgi:hypothetical protein
MNWSLEFTLEAVSKPKGEGHIIHTADQLVTAFREILLAKGHKAKIETREVERGIVFTVSCKEAIDSNVLDTALEEAILKTGATNIGGNNGYG